MKHIIGILVLAAALTSCAQPGARDDPEASVFTGLVLQVNGNVRTAHSLPPPPGADNMAIAAYSAAMSSAALLDSMRTCLVKVEGFSEPLLISDGCHANIMAGRCAKVWISPPDASGRRKTWVGQQGECGAGAP